jgi:fatty-acyl-CoA synthase
VFLRFSAGRATKNMSLAAAIRRETIYISSILRTLWLLRLVKPGSSRLICDIVAAHAKKTPNAPAIVCGDEMISYAQLDARANAYAHWAVAQGIGRGRPAALLMENRPDYIAAWLGLFKAGAAVALINTNLTGEALAHSIAIAGAAHAIVGAELKESFEGARAFLKAPLRAWVQGRDAMREAHEPIQWTGESNERRELERAAGGGDLDAALVAMPTTDPGPAARGGLTQKDRAFFIYTSGTTGLPKAANFSHMRMLFMMSGFVGALRPNASDRIYDPLPLYHSTGGVCAVGLAFFSGGALIIKRRFSVHDFWPDIHARGATMFQYVGELCRYLLNASPSPLDRGHKIRAITGNGLSAAIWEEFKTRFAIPRIVEFYGATEGNVSMLNYDGTVGAVGRVPDYSERLLPARVIRFDVETEMPLRGPDGLCVECAPDEVGEAVGGMSKRAGREFEGYTNKADSDKKMLRDVFRKGDIWFRTGDLMRRDEHGYFFFVDRIGDTFRWKGENVATSEVAAALEREPGIREVNVYGITVPGAEGRAGMAALVVDGDFNVASLAAHLRPRLPAYARPIFLRLAPALDVTGTFKQRKMDLVREGFNPAAIADPLYWRNPAFGNYEPLTPAHYADIVEGRVKL